MELTADLSNISQDYQQFLLKEGFIDHIVDIYNTKDILVKLNAAEILSKLGSSFWNSEFLVKHKLFETILQEAFDLDVEFYIQKSMVILVAKLLKNGVIKLTVAIEKGFQLILKKYFLEGKKEEIYAGLELIHHLAWTQQGLDIVISNKKVLALFFSLSISHEDVMKCKFLNAFSSFFFKNELNKKKKFVV